MDPPNARPGRVHHRVRCLAFAALALVCCAGCDSEVASVGAGGADGGGYGASQPHPMCSEQPAPGQSCGGQECDASSYCRDDTFHCGNWEGYGSCEPRPASCSAEIDPVCGCDDEVYDNSCEAARAGVDVSIAGNCTPREGTSRCGMTFCDVGSEYCEQSCCGGPTGATYDYYRCLPLSPPCSDTPTCSCLADNGVLAQDDACSQCEPGALVVTKAEPAP